MSATCSLVCCAYAIVFVHTNLDSYFCAHVHLHTDICTDAHKGLHINIHIHMEEDDKDHTDEDADEDKLEDDDVDPAANACEDAYEVSMLMDMTVGMMMFDDAWSSCLTAISLPISYTETQTQY